MRRRSPYDVLDISPIASYEEARSAFRRLAAIFHPDRFVDASPEVRAEASKQMGYLNDAWGDLRTKLQATSKADDRARADAPDPAGAPSEHRAGGTRPDRQAWGSASDDGFASRARHARTRQQARRKAAGGGSSRKTAAADAEPPTAPTTGDRRDPNGSPSGRSGSGGTGSRDDRATDGPAGHY